MTQNQLTSIVAVVEHLFPGGLNADTRVSPSSKFGDAIWKLFDAENDRLAHYGPGDLTIDWNQFQTKMGYTPLSEKILYALKLFALLYYIQPSTVISRATRSKNHPSTVRQVIRSLIPFMGHVCEKIIVASKGALKPTSLAEITASDIKKSLLDWDAGSQKDLKRALKGMTSATMRACLENDSPGWNSSDAKNFEYRAAETRDDYERVLPNPLFRLISNSATDDICGFLRFMGQKAASDEKGVIPNDFSGLDGPSLFAAYVDIRLAKSIPAKKQIDPPKYGEGIAALRNNFERYGIDVSQMLEYLYRVRNAACAAIALYTGGRFSDLVGFRLDCLQKLNGIWFMVGTHIKHEDLEKPTNEDTWVAIPLLRDAVACLKILNQITRNECLICSLHTHVKARPISASGFLTILETYVKTIDVDGTWAHITISPHRCRHTLAHQLARADLGLVLISYHLKHLHTARSAIPPSHTLLYGGIGQLKVEKALQSQAIQLDMAKALYDPDAPVAGGGAEEFIERRKQYFVGMMAEGHTKEQIIVQLASQGIPLSSVGMGYCRGRRDIKLKDGTIEKPPCTGSLQCSPQHCGNALITQTHAPVWKKVASQNTELAARPNMAYAKGELLKKVQIAEAVLADLELRS